MIAAVQAASAMLAALSSPPAKMNAGHRQRLFA
jgi:hypothetical protein